MSTGSAAQREDEQRGRERGCGLAEEPEGPVGPRSCPVPRQDGAAGPATPRGTKIPSCCVLQELGCSGKGRDSLEADVLGEPSTLRSGRATCRCFVF